MINKFYLYETTYYYVQFEEKMMIIILINLIEKSHLLWNNYVYAQNAFVHVPKYNHIGYINDETN